MCTLINYIHAIEVIFINLRSFNDLPKGTQENFVESKGFPFTQNILIQTTAVNVSNVVQPSLLKKKNNA